MRPHLLVHVEDVQPALRVIDANMLPSSEKSRQGCCRLWACFLRAPFGGTYCRGKGANRGMPSIRASCICASMGRRTHAHGNFWTTYRLLMCTLPRANHAIRTMPPSESATYARMHEDAIWAIYGRGAGHRLTPSRTGWPRFTSI